MISEMFSMLTATEYVFFEAVLKFILLLIISDGGFVLFQESGQFNFRET